MDYSTSGLPVHHQLPELAKTRPLSTQWCHPTISSSVAPFSSCLQSFPASGAFSMSQFFASGGQSIGVFEEVLRNPAYRFLRRQASWSYIFLPLLKFIFRFLTILSSCWEKLSWSTPLGQHHPSRKLYRKSVHAQAFQSCPTLCDPMDCSLPGSSVHGIFPARTLEWVAMLSSRGLSQLRDILEEKNKKILQKCGCKSFKNRKTDRKYIKITFI